MSSNNNIENDIRSALEHLREKIEKIKEKVEDLCDQTTGCIENLCESSDEDSQDCSQNVENKKF